MPPHPLSTARLSAVHLQYATPEVSRPLYEWVSGVCLLANIFDGVDRASLLGCGVPTPSKCPDTVGHRRNEVPIQVLRYRLANSDIIVWCMFPRSTSAWLCREEDTSMPSSRAGHLKKTDFVAASKVSHSSSSGPHPPPWITSRAASPSPPPFILGRFRHGVC